LGIRRGIRSGMDRGSSHIHIYIMKKLNMYCGAVWKEESGEPEICVREEWGISV
jgi:hypothetical protein